VASDEELDARCVEQRDQAWSEIDALVSRWAPPRVPERLWNPVAETVRPSRRPT
jgi:hypothetical protein